MSVLLYLYVVVADGHAYLVITISIGSDDIAFASAGDTVHGKAHAFNRVRCACIINGTAHAEGAHILEVNTRVHYRRGTDIAALFVGRELVNAHKR